MTMRARNAVLQARLNMLMFCFGVVTLWAFLATMGWMQAPKNMDINLRPAMPNKNVVLSPDGIDPAAAFQFSALILSDIYRWHEEGLKEYRDSVYYARESRLVSKSFYAYLKKDFDTRRGVDGSNQINTLLKRKRSDYVPREYMYDASSVKQDKGAFIVTLVMRSLETHNDTIVRDMLIQYTLRVGRSEESDSNQYNMQILGNEKPPVRLN